jgi:hypothetical protein
MPPRRRHASVPATNSNTTSISNDSEVPTISING